MTEKVCVVAGVGRGNGATFAHRFSRAGYRVAPLARTEDVTATLDKELGGGSKAYRVDLRSVQDVRAFRSNRE